MRLGFYFAIHTISNKHISLCYGIEHQIDGADNNSEKNEEETDEEDGNTELSVYEYIVWKTAKSGGTALLVTTMRKLCEMQRTVTRNGHPTDTPTHAELWTAHK